MFTRFDPKKFLTFAKDLSKDNKHDFQTRIRTCIGRAYYAAFLSSLDTQTARRHTFSDPKIIHQLVIDSFKSDDLSHIANKLDKLREFRRKADYYMSENFSSGDVDNCIILAENILALLNTI